MTKLNPKLKQMIDEEFGNDNWEFPGGWVDVKNIKKTISQIAEKYARMKVEEIRLSVNSWISTDNKGNEFVDELGLKKILEKLNQKQNEM